jgi:hypothetical protein
MVADFYPCKEGFAPLPLGFHDLSPHCLKGFEVSSVVDDEFGSVAPYGRRLFNHHRGKTRRYHRYFVAILTSRQSLPFRRGRSPTLP